MTTEPTDKHRAEAREIVEQLFGHGEHPLDEQLINNVAVALSSRDREIREVLAGLITHHVRHEDSNITLHWCPIERPSGYFECNDACLAARGLWNRVNLTEHAG